MAKRDSRATRQHILDTAELIFAQQGFDGARVDRIAAEAGVNKALIYYYFKNKQAILEELLSTFIDQANSILINIFKRGLEFGSPEMLAEMEKYDALFFENDKTVSLLLTESLKDSYETPPIFKLIDFSVPGLEEANVVEEMNERGFNFDKESQLRKVTEFFTGIMPTVIFSLFRKKWSDHFKIDPKEVMLLFQKANEMTHDMHHNLEKD